MAADTTPPVKGLILSGGAGTRLRPITHTSAKQLVPVANKPILFYGIEDMAEAGITEVGIIVGDTGDEIRAAVGDGSRWGLEVTYLPQDAPLGLAHCVLIARDFLGDDDFVMYLGDNLLRQGIAEFVDSFEADRAASAPPRRWTATSSRPPPRSCWPGCPTPSASAWPRSDPTARSSGWSRSPSEPPSDLALVGVYLFDHDHPRGGAAIEPSPRGELEITDAIQWLIDQGHRVRHEVLDGWWIDTGKQDPLLEGNRLVLETLEPDVRRAASTTPRWSRAGSWSRTGAEIKGSTVRGPAIIGRGTRSWTATSVRTPRSAAGCEILDSEVEHSVSSRTAGSWTSPTCRTR